MTEEKQTLVDDVQLDYSDYSKEELVTELKKIVADTPSEAKNQINKLFDVYNKKNGVNSEEKSNFEEVPTDEFIGIYNEFMNNLTLTEKTQNDVGNTEVEAKVEENEGEEAKVKEIDRVVLADETIEGETEDNVTNNSSEKLSPERDVTEEKLSDEKTEIVEKVVVPKVVVPKVVNVVVNLEVKKDIIQKIKTLSLGLKGIKATKNEFNELLSLYKATGPVAAAVKKEVSQSYHFSVMQYHQYINLTNELKEVSFKKNLLLKEEIVTKAEELVELEPIKSFNLLQDLHSKWKNVGPVAESHTEDLWKKFSEISKLINLKHRDFYLKIKDEQKKNLANKIEICEEIEKINEIEISDFKIWNKMTNEVLDIQKKWKNIGPVKKAKDNKIYKRYRKECDSFFERKQKFFEANFENFDDNIKIKEDFIKRVKELSESKDWDVAGKKIIELSAKWKKVGFIPFKKSKELWKEFKSSCDLFFESKRSATTVSMDQQKENLETKYKIIEQLNDFIAEATDNQGVMDCISAITQDWNEVGFVPKQDKEKIQNEFNLIIDKAYKSLTISANEITLLRYRLKILSLLEGVNSKQKLINEEFSIRNLISKINTTIQTYQGNISFIQGASKESEKIRNDINLKIDGDKNQITLLKSKLTLINKAKNNKL